LVREENKIFLEVWKPLPNRCVLNPGRKTQKKKLKENNIRIGLINGGRRRNIDFQYFI